MGRLDKPFTIFVIAMATNFRGEIGLYLSHCILIIYRCHFFFKHTELW